MSELTSDFRRTLNRRIRRLNSPPPQTNEDEYKTNMFRPSSLDLKSNHGEGKMSSSYDARSISSMKSDSFIQFNSGRNTAKNARGSCSMSTTYSEDDASSSPTTTDESHYNSALQQQQQQQQGDHGNANKLGSCFYGSCGSSLSVSPIPPLSPQCLRSGGGGRTPVPQNSPLLSPSPIKTSTSNQALAMVKSYNRNMRRAKSFRAKRCRSMDALTALDDEHNLHGDDSSGNHYLRQPEAETSEVTFKLRQNKYGRKGWKVMPVDDVEEESGSGFNLHKIGNEAIDKVMARIRELELSGQAVPEKMTVKV